MSPFSPLSPFGPSAPWKIKMQHAWGASFRKAEAGEKNTLVFSWLQPWLKQSSCSSPGDFEELFPPPCYQLKSPSESAMIVIIIGSCSLQLRSAASLLRSANPAAYRASAEIPLVKDRATDVEGQTRGTYRWTRQAHFSCLSLLSCDARAALVTLRSFGTLEVSRKQLA